MDKAEKTGLGTAVGGHLLLFGALSLGLLLSTERIKKPEALSVSLVGDPADVSTAPDAIQEEPAPAAAGESEPAEPPPAPEITQIPKPLERSVPKPIMRPAPREVTPPAKSAIKKPVAKPTPAKPQPAPVKSGKGTAPVKSGGFSRSFEDAVNNAGKASGTGKATGTPASKSAAQVRSAVNVSLASQIRSKVRACAPSGIDINKIETYVTLSLDPSGRLNSVTYNKQTGINDSNQPQAGPLKDCILQAVRAASPYNGLDADYHDIWKNHALRLRAAG